MRRVEVCLNVLSQNSAADATARELYNNLTPFYGELTQSRSPLDHGRHGSSGASSPYHGYNSHGHSGHSGHSHSHSHGYDSQETVSLFLTLPTGVPMEHARMPRELMAMLGQPFHSLQHDKTGNRSEGGMALDAAHLELPQISELRW